MSKYTVEQRAARAAAAQRCRAKKKAADPDAYKRMQRDANLKHAYGMTHDDFEVMLAEQGGKCKICKRGLSHELGKRNTPDTPAIDHCHTTGKVRGVLCLNCNTVLGKAYDNVDILSSAITYLKGASL